MLATNQAGFTPYTHTMKTFILKTSSYQRKHENTPAQRYARLSRILDALAFEVGAENEARLDKVRAKVRVKARSLKGPTTSEKTGPFSGLTKHELAMSGTCETDWF